MASSVICVLTMAWLVGLGQTVRIDWYFTPIAGGSVYGYDEANNKSYTSSKLPDGVTAQREEGINALFVPKGKEIDLGDFSDSCLSDPNLCGNFTVTFLLKVGNISNSEPQIIFDSGQEMSAYGWTVTIKQSAWSSSPSITGYTGTENSLQGVSEDVPANVSWMHVTFIYATETYSSDLELFVNGNKSEASGGSASSPKHNADVKTRLTLGSPKNDRDFYVAFLRFTEEKASKDDVGELYQKGLEQAKRNFSVTMKLLVSSLVVNEDVGVAKVLMERSGDLQIASSVGFQTSDGTARAPGNYIAEADGELVFKPGEVYKELQITIVDDNKKGSNKNFSVTIKKLDSPSVEVTLSGLTEVYITIIDSGEHSPTGAAVRGVMLTGQFIVPLTFAVMICLLMY